VFENRVLRGIFEPKREEVVGCWRRLHYEELHIRFSDIIRVIESRKMRWAVHVARVRGMRNAYSILVGKPEGKRLLGRRRCGWENNVRTDLREVGCTLLSL
jgi:hypothetical protein